MHIGTILQIAAEVSQKSVGEIAEESGLTRQSIYNIFNGTTSPSVDSLQKIAHAIGVTSTRVMEIAEKHRKVA